jgi:hypothetical protein
MIINFSSKFCMITFITFYSCITENKIHYIFILNYKDNYNIINISSFFIFNILFIIYIYYLLLLFILNILYVTSKNLL